MSSEWREDAAATIERFCRNARVVIVEDVLVKVMDEEQAREVAKRVVAELDEYGV